VDRGTLKATMQRLDLTSGSAVWIQPDSVKIAVPAARAAAGGAVAVPEKKPSRPPPSPYENSPFRERI
jgi:hypothetical protein